MSSLTPVQPARNRRRQIGAEKRTHPLPAVHSRPTDGQIAWSRIAIVLTIVLWALYVVTTVLREFIDHGTGDFRFVMESASYVVVVTFLTFSALMYLVARQGALLRFRAHVRVPRAELDRHFADTTDSITVLVPSYAEETAVVRATLWSAALQEFPSLRVVLLLDDPPTPTDELDITRLTATRSLASDIQTALQAPRERFTDALLRLQWETVNGGEPPVGAIDDLADDYRWAASWLFSMAMTEAVEDHVDEFFAEQVLRALGRDLSVTADALEASIAADQLPDLATIRALRRRLARIFDAELATFERKSYASLSHEANKAMNLNSYIGLMGGSYVVDESPSGRVLRSVEHGTKADLDVPDTTYVLTLDADSLLLRDYCLRLVYLLEQPENERVAVTQTPYSAFRGAATRIERLAGATTDLQHILHQGFSHYGAAFWVGANAVIRKRALDDIVELDTVGGFPVRRYVQDRTVIEDTESSIDLGMHDWRIVS